MKAFNLPFILFALSSFCQADFAGEDGYSYRRVYTNGEQYRYELKTTQEINGAFISEELGISSHEASMQSVPHETIRWEHLQKRTPQGTQSADEAARAVEPYEVSLDINGSVPLPGLVVPRMTAMITDLNTFYVAISPQIGIGRATHVGESYLNPKLAKGIWSDSAATPLGQDCTQIRVSLAGLEPARATYETSFLPPAKDCLRMVKEWMSPPVAGSLPNNFQQIRKISPGKFEVMWGREEFTIRAIVARVDGKLLSGTMENTLTLKMRTCSDAELLQCAEEFRLAIHRSLELRLLR